MKGEVTQGAGEKERTARMQSQLRDPVPVARHHSQTSPGQTGRLSSRDQLLPALPVPDPDGAVVRGREQPGVEGVEEHAPDVVSVACQAELGPGDLCDGGVPQPDPGVVPATSQQGLRGVVTQAPNWGRDCHNILGERIVTGH